MNRKKIYWIKKKSLSGGSAYEKYLYQLLTKKYDLNYIETNTVKTYNPIQKIINRLEYLKTLKNYNIKEGIIIRDFFTTALVPFTNKQENIVLIHHIDTKVLTHKIEYLILKYLFYKNLWKADKIVVVSKFWQEHFTKRGYKNVSIAYNCFDLKEFNIKNKDVITFVNKYKLNGKPIIYIGNCQKAKGVIETYNALRGLNAHLVTSGRKDVELPVKHLNLNYKEYLTLLKASSVVVTMSTFNEGWCRTAHEAMLLKTPVIGSGKGGMKELLSSSKQKVCMDYSQLKNAVINILRYHIEIGKLGYINARRFSIERFNKVWIEIIG